MFNKIIHVFVLYIVNIVNIVNYFIFIHQNMFSLLISFYSTNFSIYFTVLLISYLSLIFDLWSLIFNLWSLVFLLYLFVLFMLIKITFLFIYTYLSIISYSYILFTFHFLLLYKPDLSISNFFKFLYYIFFILINRWSYVSIYCNYCIRHSDTIFHVYILFCNMNIEIKFISIYVVR